MVKNRKPLMVSEAALEKLKALSLERKMFMGDLVDSLLDIRSLEDLNKEYELKPHISKRLRKGHAGDGHLSVDSRGLGVRPTEERGGGEEGTGQGDVPREDSEPHEDTPNDNADTHGQGLRIVLT